MLFIALIFLLIIVFIISYFIRIYTTFHFYLHNENKFIHIKVKILGINVYKRDMLVPSSQTESQVESKDSINIKPKSFLDSLTTIKDIMNQVIDSKKIVRRLIAKVHVHKFEWSTNFGTGDASITGMLSGGLWAIKGTIVAIIVNHMIIKANPSINVVPIFQHKYLYSECKCIVSVRVGQTIMVLFSIFRQLKKKNASLNRKLA